MAKILIVEDEEVLMDVLKKKLEQQNYEVATAPDGEAGLKAIEEWKPDLVLLDIMMPKVDGMEVMATLKQKGIMPGLPVVIISNSGQPVELDKAMEYGARDALVKAEFDPQEVLDKVQKYLPADGTGVSFGDGESFPNSGGNPQANKPLAINPKDYKVLVVEDDQFLRDLLSQKLRKEGFDVTEANDGDMALDLAKKIVPHIILLDLIIPGLTGFEVLEKVKAEANLAQVPVLLLSNLGQKDDIKKGMELGATDYMIKAHSTPGEIIEKIATILSQPKSA